MHKVDPRVVPGPDTRPPLLSWTGLVLALLIAMLLSWPMLLVTAPLAYFDTLSYYRTGHAALQLLQTLLATPDPVAAGGGGGGAAAAEGARNLRSLAYSTYLYLTAQTPLGMVLGCWIQTALTLFLLFAFIDRPVSSPVGWPALWTRPLALAGLVGLVLLTPLPWVASYAMPDMPSAIVVLYGALLLRRIDSLSLWQGAVLAAIAAFGVGAHYGHPPLAVAVFGLALLWRLVTRRLTLVVVLAAAVPIAAALAVNLAASLVAFDTASVAPKRMPILLARSMEDGPARWYLDEACPEAGYAICELFDEMPGDIGILLWQKDGLKRATDAQMNRIRAEEMPILVAAFRAYPLQQSWSLLENMVIQLVSIGNGQIMPLIADPADPHWSRVEVQSSQADRYPVIAVFGKLVWIGTLWGGLTLAVLWRQGRIRREEGEILLLCLAALCVNAAIFGGLSEPADRYQNRLVWILPAFALLWAARPLPGRSRFPAAEAPARHPRIAGAADPHT